MFKKIAIRSLALFTICAGANLPTEQAAAIVANYDKGFAVDLDCHGNGGLPSWAGTNDTITVDAKVNGKWVRVGQTTPTVARCPDGPMVMTRDHHSRDVESIRISTNGTDGFWLDRVALTTLNISGAHFGTRHTLKTWGVDNNMGYMVSKDAKDGNNSYSVRGRAYSSWTFNR